MKLRRSCARPGLHENRKAVRLRRTTPPYSLYNVTVANGASPYKKTGLLFELPIILCFAKNFSSAIITQFLSIAAT